MFKRSTIGENIRQKRKERNFSQEQLAKAVGISTATLSAYETDKSVPTSSVIYKLAAVLSTSVDSLLPIPSPDKESTFIF